MLVIPLSFIKHNAQICEFVIFGIYFLPNVMKIKKQGRKSALLYLFNSIGIVEYQSAVKKQYILIGKG